MKILVINPGSTSTKVAVFEDENAVFTKSISHDAAELAQYKEIHEQMPMRKALILEVLKENNIEPVFDAVIGRGGLTPAIPAGVYSVNDRMVHDVTYTTHHHASNLGCILAREIANGCGAPSFIADPVVVDELDERSRTTGSPLLPRTAIWHALNQRAIARRHAKEVGKKFEELDLIVVHLGGGVTVACHQHGRAIDVNNGLDGEGAFSPERAGTLPAGDLVELCFSGKYTKGEVKKMIAGKGGLVAHLGTNDSREIEQRIADGDKHAKEVYDAMSYQIAKSVAALSVRLQGKIDGILFTGGMARSTYLMDDFKNYLSWLAPIYVYPGENEMEALALNALGVLRGELEAKEYNPA